MIYTIFFASGLVVGLAVAVPIVTLFWLGANKAAELKYRTQLLNSQVQIMNTKKKVDDSIARLKAAHEDMTPEQEEIAREHLRGNIFQARQAR